MAMSRDRGTQQQKRDFRYGIVCDAGGKVTDGLLLTGANQEHGIVARGDGAVERDIVERFPVGTLLRILPNHACATGAQFPYYHAIGAQGGLQTWRRFDGW